MKAVVALILGQLFGAGLYVAGMTNPAKVQNFLDLWVQWDPSLMFVMGAAIPVAAIGYALLSKRGESTFGSLQIPTAKHIDARLIGGSCLFGMGWAIGGFCPGPGVASLALQPQVAVVFLLAMAVGMFGHARLVQPVSHTA